MRLGGQGKGSLEEVCVMGMGEMEWDFVKDVGSAGGQVCLEAVDGWWREGQGREGAFELVRERKLEGRNGG